MFLHSTKITCTLWHIGCFCYALQLTAPPPVVGTVLNIDFLVTSLLKRFYFVFASIIFFSVCFPLTVSSVCVCVTFYWLRHSIVCLFFVYWYLGFCLKFVPARSIVVFVFIFNPSVWVIVVAKRLVRLTKIRFFNFSEQKIEFLLINGGILSVAHFCFRSTLIWLFLFANALRKVRRLVLGLFIFVFYSNDSEFIFRGLFNTYQRSVL